MSLREEKADEELQAAKEKVLLELLGKKPMKEGKAGGRNLTPAQQTAMKCLEQEVAFEVVTQTVQFGNDEVDPVTKQVLPYARRKALVAMLTVEPETKIWIEHIMKAMQNVPLNKKEVELFRHHIRRLSYQGALRDYYEFYGMTKREREGR